MLGCYLDVMIMLEFEMNLELVLRCGNYFTLRVYFLTCCSKAIWIRVPTLEANHLVAPLSVHELDQVNLCLVSFPVQWGLEYVAPTSRDSCED